MVFPLLRSSLEMPKKAFEQASHGGSRAASSRRSGCLQSRWAVVVKTVLGSHFGWWVNSPPIWVYFSWDWDVHWGYDLDFDPWPFFRVWAIPVGRKLIHSKRQVGQDDLRPRKEGETSM